MGISKEASVWHTRTQLSAIAAVIFVTAFHPAIAKARGSGGPTDPQIVGIVETADDIDINYAKLALSKTKDQQVRDFAHQMITDHSAVQKSVINLASKLDLTPADSPTSDSLKTEAQQTLEKLRSLKGKAFEKSYVDNEVGYHEAVIHTTNTVLIPSAQNAELKSALQSAKPLFEGDLAHAAQVQFAIESRRNTASK